MGKKVDLVGKRFERILVIKEAHKNKHGVIFWECICDCGIKKTINGDGLKSGHIKSCGCYQIDDIIKRATIHGGAKKDRHYPEYHVWQSMISRCTNPNNKQFNRYGARGITVCDRWLNSFFNFIKDMGRRPIFNSPREYSLDRINNDGNYEPSNCRWATLLEQASNRRNNKWFEYDNKKMIVQDWARFLGVNHANFLAMINRNSFEYAFNHYMLKSKIKSC